MSTHRTVWGFERALALRLPDLTHRGRPIVQRDRSVRGCVLYHGWPNELATDIDYPNNPVYERLWTRAKELASVAGITQQAEIPRAVGRAVREAVPYSRGGRKSTQRRMARSLGMEALQPGDLIPLSAYLHADGAQCLDHAAATTALLEDFRDLGYLPDEGQISLDRNAMRRSGGSWPGHAWTRYSSGLPTPDTTFIVDAAHNYYGTLRASTTDALWNYMRPEDVVQMRIGRIGPHAGAITASLVATQ